MNRFVELHKTVDSGSMLENRINATDPEKRFVYILFMLKAKYIWSYFWICRIECDDDICI